MPGGQKKPLITHPTGKPTTIPWCGGTWACKKKKFLFINETMEAKAKHYITLINYINNIT
jgi:hypothetical protein